MHPISETDKSEFMEEIKILGIRKCCFLLLALLSFTIMADAQSGNADPHERLWQSFLTPPDSIRVGCYYYWVNEQVEPEGVKADLQWMKDNGITLAFLATDIRNRTRWDNPWAGQTFGKPSVVGKPAHSTEDGWRTRYRDGLVQLSGLEPVGRAVGETGRGYAQLDAAGHRGLPGCKRQ